LRTPSNESELVQAAAAGDGRAFLALYDFYEQPVFTFCHRLLGSVDAAADATQDAFLEVLPGLGRLTHHEAAFGVAVLGAARTVCYERLAHGPRTDDVAPQSLAAANARLRPRQRAVLALHGLAELSYAEVAAVMDMDRDAVPGLLARARLRLRDELQGSAIAAAAMTSASCEEALPLMAATADGELPEGADGAWLAAHLASCESCGLTRRAMAEGASAYHAWSPSEAPVWLRRATLADAAEQSGADWAGALADVPSHPAPGQLALEPQGPPARRVAAVAAADAAGAGAAAASAPAAAAAAPAAPPPGGAGPDRHAMRRRRRGAASLVGTALVLLGFAALVLAEGGNLDFRAPKQLALQVPSRTPTVEVAAAPAAPATRVAASRHAGRRPAVRSHRGRRVNRSSGAILARYVPRAHRRVARRVVSAPVRRPQRIVVRKHRASRQPRAPHRRPTVHHRRPHVVQPAPAPGPAPAPAPPAPQQTASAPPPSSSPVPGVPVAVPIAPVGCSDECKDDDGDGNDQGHDNGNGQGGDGDGDSQGQQGAVPGAGAGLPGCAPAGLTCGQSPRCRPWANCHNGHGKGNGHVELGAITAPAAALLLVATLAWPRRRRRQARRGAR
jgi:RNA polymerase sigma-70 factor (ECF subfamily)